MGETEGQRRVLKDLVELYPGFLVLETYSTGHNPVRERFSEIVKHPHSRYLADLYIEHVVRLRDRMEKAFPDRFEAARKSLQGDIDAMKAIYESKYSQL